MDILPFGAFAKGVNERVESSEAGKLIASPNHDHGFTPLAIRPSACQKIAIASFDRTALTSDESC